MTALGKRGKWIEFPSKRKYLFILGGVGVELSRWKKSGEWEVVALGKGWVIKAPSLSQAKSKALRKVQRAILEAAEAWKGR